MSIYTMDIKIILKKEMIGERREHIDTLTNPSNALVLKVLASICILTDLLTADKMRARFRYFAKYQYAVR